MDIVVSVFIAQLLLVFAGVQPSLGVHDLPKDEAKLPEGRILSLDRLVRRYIDKMHKGADEPIDLKNVIKKAKKLAAKELDEEHAQYYVHLLEKIQEHQTMAILHDERERLEVMDTDAHGLEHHYVLTRTNVVESFFDAAADQMLKAFGMDGDDTMFFPGTQMDPNAQFHDEI